MTKKRKSPAGPRSTDSAQSGRVAPKPCPVRGGGQFCAPLNHVNIKAKREYWACSCGRRYSRMAYRSYVRSASGWVDR